MVVVVLISWRQDTDGGTDDKFETRYDKEHRRCVGGTDKFETSRWY
jgi:hypothetical protein